MEMTVEEEIDIRPYVEALLRHWIWIVAAVGGTAVLAFLISSILPPTYEATALIAITEPNQILRFDPRIQTQLDDQPLRAYPELALSDELLQQLLTEAGGALQDVETIQQARSKLEATSGSDLSLLRLTVRDDDPAQAAEVANTWAMLAVAWINRLYGEQNGDQLEFFEAQVQAAETELEAAEQALIEFQQTNRSQVVSNTLSIRYQTQSEYLRRRRQIADLSRNVDALQAQMTAGSGSAVSFAEQMTALSLQLQAFEAEEMPLLLQPVGGETAVFTPQERAAQAAALERLADVLATKAEALDAELAALEPEILSLQGEYQRLLVQQHRLRLNRRVANDTYTALARKVEEERISSQDESSGARLASRTAVPQEPVAPRRLVNTLLGGVLGLVSSLFVVLFLTWLRGGDRLRAG